MARLIPSAAALRHLNRTLRQQEDGVVLLRSRVAQIQKIQKSCKNLQERAYTLGAQQRDQRQQGQTTQINAPTRRIQPQSSTNVRLDNLIKKEFVLDEAITSRFVQVKQHNADTGRTSLGEPIALREALRDVNREHMVLRQIGKSDGTKPAIVETCSKESLAEELRKRDERVAETKKNARLSKPKQVELNWAIGGHDLDIKMKQLTEFVEKGKKVEILLASRKRQRRATFEEAQALHKRIRDTVAEIGAKEIKPMEGAIGAQAMMTVQKLKTKEQKMEEGDG